MGSVIPDEVVDEFAVSAPLESLGEAIRTKYQGRLDRVGLYFSNIPGQPPLVEVTDDEWAAIVAGIRG